MKWEGQRKAADADLKARRYDEVWKGKQLCYSRDTCTHWCGQTKGKAWERRKWKYFGQHHGDFSGNVIFQVLSRIFSLSLSLSVSFISYFFSVHELSWHNGYTNNSNSHKTMLWLHSQAQHKHEPHRQKRLRKRIKYLMEQINLKPQMKPEALLEDSSTRFSVRLMAEQLVPVA